MKPPVSRPPLSIDNVAQAICRGLDGRPATEGASSWLRIAIRCLEAISEGPAEIRSMKRVMKAVLNGTRKDGPNDNLRRAFLEAIDAIPTNDVQRNLAADDTVRSASEPTVNTAASGSAEALGVFAMTALDVFLSPTTTPPSSDLVRESLFFIALNYRDSWPSLAAGLAQEYEQEYIDTVVHVPPRGDALARQESVPQPKKEIQQSGKQVILDLNELRRPENDGPLVDVIKHADLATPTLQRIRDVVLGRLGEVADADEIVSSKPSGKNIHEAAATIFFEETLRTQRENMRTRVFGRYEPRLELFQAYLDRLATSDADVSGDPSIIVKTINYCRSLKEVQAVLFYVTTLTPHSKAVPIPCRLKPLTGSRYQLLGLGEYKDVSLYSDRSFPPLIARPAPG